MEDRPTVDELLKIAEGSEKETSSPEKIQKKERKSKYKRNVESFIREFGIRSGTTKVPMYKLYYEYRMWRHESRREKATPVEFGRIFNLHFDQKRTNSYRYYLLEPFCDMSKEALKKAEQHYRQFYIDRKMYDRKRKEKKEQKGTDET